ncbi:cytochrome d ubiquinol oxidase subunit II [Sporolactobacillus kofuensis]|uniref:Cytochrome d ubiquinol oxidase subunit II n=1 Tax=Sporolactobacillus kofuensis TaxID=269672 RepID=A0ABW1WD64_9BACL|nr:cytochrome d ubiquinol oxidase subunit II [Sporolactobacillus kofuensis]MCO7174574.1 cytochrome d ubiquinol oxidase subunit II [Sporolactobacillus kofuensis]
MVQQLILIILWVIIYCYMIAASIDFGTAFYLFYSQQRNLGEQIISPLLYWMSPLSEIMNIGFILLFTAVLSLSPEIILNFQMPLVFCGVLALTLTVLKGTCAALADLLPKENRLKKLFFMGNGITGIFVPIVLSIVLVISEGGFSGYGTGHLGSFVVHLLSNFYFWSVMIIAVVSIFYISAMYLIHFGMRSKNESLVEHFRNIALFWSMPTVLASGLVFLGLERQNPQHFTSTLDVSWMFMLSLISLLGAVSLVFMRRYKGFFILVMLQYFFALIGYTLSHFPFLIYPDIMMDHHLALWANSRWFFISVMIVSLIVLSAFLRSRNRVAIRNEANK